MCRRPSRREEIARLFATPRTIRPASVPGVIFVGRDRASLPDRRDMSLEPFPNGDFGARHERGEGSVGRAAGRDSAAHRRSKCPGCSRHRGERRKDAVEPVFGRDRMAEQPSASNITVSPQASGQPFGRPSHSGAYPKPARRDPGGAEDASCGASSRPCSFGTKSSRPQPAWRPAARGAGRQASCAPPATGRRAGGSLASRSFS